MLDPCGPGQKVRGFLTVPDTNLQLPYTFASGVRPGPLLFVTGGIHGGEYVGIEAAIRFAKSLDPLLLTGRVAVLHLANPSAFFQKTQYIVPSDGKNLNRVFPGRAQGTAAERTAAVITEWAGSAAFWVDLHSGDLHEALLPFAIYSAGGAPAVTETSKLMAKAYGIPHIVESNTIAGGSYAVAAKLGIPALLAESGGMGQLDEEAVQVHLTGLHNLLGALGFQDHAVDPAPVQVFRQFLWTHTDRDGLFYSHLRPGQQVRAGQPAGVLKDVFGDVVTEWTTPSSGVVLFHVTSLAVVEGDPLFAIASP